MDRLGKYDLIEVIGKGGFGTVYRATDRGLGRVVALKVLHPQLAADSEFIARFEAEARLTAGLEHPNIVTVYDVDEEQGYPYIAMRCYTGGSLTELIKKGPLSWERSAAILGQVCAGLQKLHERGWVHRDLKPSNILFDGDGHAVVSDFGLARAVTASGSSSSSLGGAGTPFYRAPELWRGKPPASPATDVYSLGCVLGEMLGGKALFEGATPDEVITRHLIDGAEFGPDWPPRGLPGGAQALLAKALAKDPAQRYADAKALGLALSQVGQAPPRAAEAPRPVAVPAAVKTPSPAAAPKPKPKPLNWTAIGGVGAAFVLGAALIWLLSGPLGGRAAPAPSVTALPQVTATVVPSPIAMPTATPVPSPTLQDTATPVPSPTLQDTATPVPSPTPKLDIGSRLTRAEDGMVMVYVPEGPFSMGSDSGQADEKPAHSVDLPAFWIDQTEVTNSMFQIFTSATQYQTEAESLGKSWVFNLTAKGWGEVNGADWKHPTGPGSSWLDLEQHPVVHVSWQDASAYCLWAGKARLPGEAEWEKAARWTDARIYPWGDPAPAGTLANFADVNLGVDWANKNQNDGYPLTAPVGHYPAGASRYGALDMAGNVWEWTADWYKMYPGGDPNASADFGETYRVVRGGSWDHNVDNLRSSNRDWNNPSNRDDNIGFRCAR